MLLLDAPSKSIEVGLAVNADTPLVWYVTYADHTTTAFTPGSSHGTVSLAYVTAVAAPGAGVQRQVKFMSVHNPGVGSATVRVRVAAVVSAVIASFTLQAGDLLQYTDGDGFRVLTSSGSSRQATTTTTLTGGVAWEYVESFVGDGVATAFDLLSDGVDADPRNHMVTRNGLIMEIGAGNDYEISAGTGESGVDQLLFVNAPPVGTKIAIRYMKEPS